MVELLKQPQYQPMHVIDQVMSIYAGTRGHLDDVAVKDVRSWEEAFIKFMHERRQEVVDELTRVNDMNDAIAAKLVAAIQGLQGELQVGHRQDGTASSGNNGNPMAKARTLDKRRGSIRNIRKITRTMELIANARFKKAMDRATSARLTRSGSRSWWPTWPTAVWMFAIRCWKTAPTPSRPCC